MNGLIFGRCKYELWLGQYRYWVALEIIPTPALILHEVYGSNFCTLLGSLPSCTHWQCWLWVRTFAHRHLHSSSGPSSHASKLVTKYSKQLTPTTTPSVKKITPQVYCTSCVLHLHKIVYQFIMAWFPGLPCFFFCFFFVFSITHRNGRVAFMFILNANQRTKSKRHGNDVISSYAVYGTHSMAMRCLS